MKLFSLIARSELFFVGGSSGVPMGHVITEHYPTATVGIALDQSDRTVRVGWGGRVPVSDELLALPPESGAITREGPNVTILRASLAKRPDGTPILVPERCDDKVNALAYLDVGHGGWLSSRYTPDPESAITLVRADVGWGMYDEQLLAVLNPLQPLVAERVDKKYWFFGPERIREKLFIKFDGRTLFYDVIKP